MDEKESERDGGKSGKWYGLVKLIGFKYEQIIIVGTYRYRCTLESSGERRAPAKDAGEQSDQMQPCSTGTRLHRSLAMDTLQAERGVDRAQTRSQAYQLRYTEHDQALESSGERRASAKDAGEQSDQMQPCSMGTRLHRSLAMDTLQEERGVDRAQTRTPVYPLRYTEHEQALESSAE